MTTTPNRHRPTTSTGGGEPITNGHHYPRTAHKPDEPAITAEFAYVTPDLARMWLATNTNNRPLRRNLVKQYGREFTEDRWQFNGEPVQFSDDGTLLNGQHRLSSIAESEVAVWLLVVRGLPTRSQDTMDGGSKRNAADVLHLTGEYDGVRDSRAVAAAARVALSFATGRTDLSKTEVAEFVAEHPDLVAACSRAAGYRDIPGTTPSAVAYAYWKLSAVDAEQCEVFFSRLAGGHNLPVGSPILALSRALIREGLRGNSLATRAERISLIFNAWNAWRRGDTREFIRVNRDRRTNRVLIPVPK